MRLSMILHEKALCNFIEPHKNQSNPTTDVGHEVPQSEHHRRRTYIGNLGSHHLLVQAGNLRVVLVSIATQMKPQGPVRNHHWPTNQLENRQKNWSLKRRIWIEVVHTVVRIFFQCHKLDYQQTQIRKETKRMQSPWDNLKTASCQP